MPSCCRNCYSLLRLRLISRSPLRLGSNIVAFHKGGTSLIPDILIYALFLIVKVISSIILISFIYIYIYIYIYMYMLYISSECSAQRQVFHCKRRNLGCSSAECRSPTTNSGTKAAVLLWMNRYVSVPLFSAPHSLFSIWTDLKRSEKTPGAPTWMWGEWIWLTGPSGLHRISSYGLNISSIRVFDPSPQININIIKFNKNRS